MPSALLESQVKLTQGPVLLSLRIGRLPGGSCIESLTWRRSSQAVEEEEEASSGWDTVWAKAWGRDSKPPVSSEALCMCGPSWDKCTAIFPAHVSIRHAFALSSECSKDPSTSLHSGRTPGLICKPISNCLL